MSPSEAHSALQAAFAYLLRPLRDQGLRVRTELRIVRGSARVPDVTVYVLADLAPAVLLRGRYPTRPPQIAIEIRSPDEDWSDQVDRYGSTWMSGDARWRCWSIPSPVRPRCWRSVRGDAVVYRGHERIGPLYDGFGLELTPHAVWSEANLES